MNLAVQNELGNLQEMIKKVFDVCSSVSDPMITFLKNDTAAKDREDDASFPSEDRAARECVSSVFDRLRQACAGCIDQMEQHLRHGGCGHQTEAGNRSHHEMIVSLSPSNADRGSLFCRCYTHFSTRTTIFRSISYCKRNGIPSKISCNFSPSLRI